jgi:hypothetical protein
MPKTIPTVKRETGFLLISAARARAPRPVPRSRRDEGSGDMNSISE